MSKTDRFSANPWAVTLGDRPWQTARHPFGKRARSTPVLPSAFLNDHASDEDSSPVLPFRAAQNQTIFSAWIAWQNYFFEWLVWLGFAIYGLAFLEVGGWLALVPQGIVLASIWKVTGIPATEAQALRSKGDAYRAYQQRVSVFVPRPPKRSAH